MKRKPIKIDWEELEAAFESRREDLVYYLDLVTGQVVLEGEGGDLRDDGDDSGEDADAGPLARPATDRLYVEPPDPELETIWMEDFVALRNDGDPSVLDKLSAAIDAPDAVDAVREVLRQHPAERDRWFLYRSERLHQTIDAWLESNSVHPTEPPPWR